MVWGKIGLMSYRNTWPGRYLHLLFANDLKELVVELKVELHSLTPKWKPMMLEMVEVLPHCHSQGVRRFNGSLVKEVLPLSLSCLVVTEYEGDIQLETIQLALDHITSLGQDGNLPEYVQGILNDIKLFYEGGDKRDGTACALKGGRSLVIISKF
ncbi:hypothetical protein V501_09329 [Pseudogymnoascus sp. VKM F-4519 (FW-2642)]|nr:hypothetical protein V501_09329 [Pseudogymnoascus sp. VKM F-4519 (FW-2642)]